MPLLAGDCSVLRKKEKKFPALSSTEIGPDIIQPSWPTQKLRRHSRSLVSPELSVSISSVENLFPRSQTSRIVLFLLRACRRASTPRKVMPLLDSFKIFKVEFLFSPSAREHTPSSQTWFSSRQSSSSALFFSSISARAWAPALPMLFPTRLSHFKLW